MTETVQIIKNLMEKHKTLQCEMAIKIGVTEASMSRWMQGTRNPNIKYVERMAEALGYKLQVRNNIKKMGHWMHKLDSHFCSECNAMGIDCWDYCPYCGSYNKGTE